MTAFWKAERWTLLLLAAAPAFAGTIAGVTRAALTGEPISGAAIEARSGAHEFTAAGDSSGRFLLSGLPPGRYIVAGRKEGWIASHRTQRPVWVSSTDNETEVAIDFVTPASLSGRVVDENRAPVKGVTVTIESAHGFGGINQTVGAGGTFSFDGLEPGEYVLSARPAKISFGTGFVHWDSAGIKLPPAIEGQSRAWATTFYPNAADPSQTQRLHLTPGSATAKLDIILRAEAAHPFEGRVLDSRGDPVKTNLLAWRRDATFAEHSALAGANGRFRIEAIGEGDWTISAHHPGGSARGTAAEQITIAGPPGRRLDIRLELPFSVDVTLDLPVSVRPEQRRSFVLLLEPVDLSPDFRVRGTAGSSANIRLDRVHRGRYRVVAHSLLAGVYVASAKFGDQEVLGQVISLNLGAPSLRLVFREGRATLSGQVEKGAGAPVIAIPEDPARLRAAGSRIAECDSNGRYRIAEMAPGSYRVLALDLIPAGAEPRFEERLPGGTSVTIKDGESASADLKVTPWPLPLY